MQQILSGIRTEYVAALGLLSIGALAAMVGTELRQHDSLAAAITAAAPPAPVVSTFATGFALPTAMEFAPDGRLFVAEKAGKIKIVENGTVLSQPFLSLPVATYSERGLVGITFDPSFTENGYVYAYYTKQNPVKNRLSRFTADPANPDTVLAGSEVVLLDDIPSDAGNHNGGAVHFGPDGKLYVAVGDGGASSTNAQLLSSLSGKMLRLNPDGSIPSDNPFAATPGARGEIWALGLRNPFTFAFDPATGKMHINDVGQRAREEINVGASGANFGWPVCEGNCRATTSTLYINPFYQYGHIATRGGAAIAGGAFYEEGNFPAEKAGSYFFGDYVLGFVRELSSTGAVTDLLSPADTPVDLRFGPDGALYYLSIGSGSVYRIGYPSFSGNPPVAVARATPTAGPVPLTVAFAGTESFDPDGDVLAYEWDFGDGATATEPSPAHTYQTPGTYTASLIVRDGENASTPSTVSISAGAPPTGVIVKPAASRTYAGGARIALEGTAADPVAGTLPASAISWTVVFHHDDHTHPFLGPIVGTSSTSFVVPKTGETAPNVWYRINMTVTNQDGLSRTYARDVHPKTATLSLSTNPSGLSLILDGQPTTTPTALRGVHKMTRTLSAPLEQTKGGKRYRFSGWSQGGSRTQTFPFPTSNSSWVANYQLVP